MCTYKNVVCVYPSKSYYSWEQWSHTHAVLREKYKTCSVVELHQSQQWGSIKLNGLRWTDQIIILPNSTLPNSHLSSIVAKDCQTNGGNDSMRFPKHPWKCTTFPSCANPFPTATQNRGGSTISADSSFHVHSTHCMKKLPIRSLLNLAPFTLNLCSLV